MTHELKQFVYGLDVAEVGVEEANRRWEYYSESDDRWYTLEYYLDKPLGFVDCFEYRRKPGLPMPVVVSVRGAGTVDQFFDSGVANSFAIPGLAKATEWPANAPKWAVAAGYTFYATLDSAQLSGQRVVVRPQPPKQQIDWSKLSPWVREYWYCDRTVRWNDFPSSWIPWNVDGCGFDRPVPEGVLVRVKYSNGLVYDKIDQALVNWSGITAFQIVGKADGWE